MGGEEEVIKTDARIARTDAYGNFSLRGVGTSDVGIWGAADTRVGEVSKVEAGTSGVSLRLEIARSATLEGRVTRQGSGIAAVLQLCERNEHAACPHRAVATADGSYRIPNARAGACVLRTCLLQGEGSIAIQSITLEAGEAREHSVEVSSSGGEVKKRAGANRRLPQLARPPGAG
ncbi:MAG: hypothetical protein GY811_07030 [Myxococcales bacterium]|nr:hypothetical protein [Myxococcales bacterium]